MPEPTPETRRTQFLLSNLILLTVLILSLVIGITIYPRLFPARPKLPATVTPLDYTPGQDERPSATASITLRPSLTPSITATSSQTPTLGPSATPPGPPTLTPAQVVFADPYVLAKWTPESADLMIGLMKDYPNLLPTEALEEDSSAYYDAFAYATYALREGLLRFPEAAQAAQWQTDLAFTLAATGNQQAGQAYADLITQALNSGETEPYDLSEWFGEREVRLELRLIPLDSPSGFLSSQLVEIHGPGSAFIWLLETPTGFQASLLEHNFDFPADRQATALVADLTADGNQEAVIYKTPGEDFNLTLPRIYSLEGQEAIARNFRPSDSQFEIGIEHPTYWKIGQDAEGNKELVFETEMFPTCPVTVRRSYRWDGEYFSLVDSQVSVKPNSATLAFCSLLIEHVAATWGAQAATQVMEGILPVWPPEEDINGEPVAQDALDELRFKLGLNYALNGESDKALEILKTIIEEPSTENSRWVAQATQFLGNYQQPEDVYRACVEEETCSPTEALSFLINNLAEDDQDATLTLRNAGVPINATGFFDFDQDGISERWFTVRHRPFHPIELWVLVQGPDRTHGISLGNLDSDAPVINVLDESQSPPVVKVNTSPAFRLLRDPDTFRPYLEFPASAVTSTNRFQSRVDELSLALLNGEEPEAIIDALLQLEEDPGLLCKVTWSCDKYQYTLGLAYELAGDERKAIDTYKQLWADYFRSPFTIMARLKLLPTITPPTATVGPSPTATLPVTPGTITPIATGGASTSTPIPTLPPPYPYPVITPTETSPYPSP